jgi:pimeloyl-ACP methyl ester carboxylesterase
LERDFLALTKAKPTLVIWGDKDPHISPSFAERFNARKVSHVPVGHWAPAEAPAECAAAIAEFLVARKLVGWAKAQRAVPTATVQPLSR